MENPTPGYISTLLQPMAERGSDRRAWSIPLQGVWLPFFTATNTQGETAIHAEVLGAPLRLVREKDGTPRFSKTGRPVIRVVKELSDQIRIVRENFTYGLLSYADTIQKARPKEYKAQVEASRKAGEPIAQKDAVDLATYLASLKAETEAVAEVEAITETEKELVAA